MPARDDDHTGTRIREQRRLARLTQRQLAARIPYSYSLLNQVECGARPATADFVAAVAQALRIDAAVLTGQPYVTELQQDRLAALVRPIREALDLYDLDVDAVVTARPAEQLVAAADQLCRTVRATRLRAAANAAPDLIAELTAAAHTTPSTELWRALASAYRSAHDITLKLGYHDLSSIALDRLGWAADRASDAQLGAIRQYRRALAYRREGATTIGLRLVASGHRMLDQADPGRETAAVRGQLHLGAAVIAARARDASLVTAHLEQAGALTGRAGTGSEAVHWLSFGEANVALHTMSTDIEMRRYDAVLRLARTVRPATMPASRRARFLVDRARAELETGRTDASLASLVEARRVAPEQTRYHPSTRETISGLVHAARRAPETLSGMATWVGL
ncbi:helix-turn-helix domain-containing protein [Streptomyces sp. NPDC020983]|uniref:helix-turn-helix domain-containing protein n=1 Tax=Streptomyces sp. NPDC020983 TaxID=3365106 RepID=UPI003792192E